jgi:GH24 family phage-related lysozyme (muramidase)
MTKGMNTLFWIGFASLTLYMVFESNKANAVNVSSGIISDEQLQKIEDAEQFMPTAYADGSSNGVQLYSIGYGHQIQPSESYLLNSTLSQQQAEQILINDISKIEDVLNGSGINYTQGQFDALLDFGFSSGTGALMSAVEAFINQGSAGVINYLRNYIYWHPVPGGPAVVNPNLITRRNNEIATWNS